MANQKIDISVSVNFIKEFCKGKVSKLRIQYIVCFIHFCNVDMYHMWVVGGREQELRVLMLLFATCVNEIINFLVSGQHLILSVINMSLLKGFLLRSVKSYEGQ